MKPQPLPKHLLEKAKQFQLAEIVLEFSGGNDEGYLNVSTGQNEGVPEPDSKELQAFHGEVEQWAWEVYDYSGAGDGNDYGDDITYDLDKNKVTYSEWCMVREDQPAEEMNLECATENE